MIKMASVGFGSGLGKAYGRAVLDLWESDRDRKILEDAGVTEKDIGEIKKTLKEKVKSG